MMYRRLGETDGAFRRRQARRDAGVAIFAAVAAALLVLVVWTFSTNPPPVPVPW